MKPSLRLLSILLFAGLAHAAAPEPARAAPAAEPRDPHTLEQERSRVRQLHLRRLDEKLIVEPHVLRESCRYESDIPTHPPARQVAITFDDGPEPVQTEYILDTLRKYNIGATFFLIGEKAKAHPELVAKIQASGMHIVGNHSWSHPNFHEIPAETQAEEFHKAADALPLNSALKLFRYPYGNASCPTNDLVHAEGYRIVGWHVDSCDWAFDRTGEIDTKEALACGVTPQDTRDFVGHVVASVRAHNGGIVLLHEIHPHTLAQLEEIIRRLKEDGFQFSRLDNPVWDASMR